LSLSSITIFLFILFSVFEIRKNKKSVTSWPVVY
jgi:hypothetical protein